MTGSEYQQHIDKLGLSQSAAGRFLQASPRSSRRWVVDGPPPMVAMILTLMVRGGLTPADVNRMMGDEARERSAGMAEETPDARA